MIVNPRLAGRGQIHGAVIMGISTALYEQRVHGQQTGRMLKWDMEVLQAGRIDDIGENHRCIWTSAEENDKRGIMRPG